MRCSRLAGQGAKEGLQRTLPAPPPLDLEVSSILLHTWYPLPPFAHPPHLDVSSVLLPLPSPAHTPHLEVFSILLHTFYPLPTPALPPHLDDLNRRIADGAGPQMLQQVTCLDAPKLHV